MKITPMASPAQTAQRPAAASQTANTNGGNDARARAIAKLIGQESPPEVQNQNAVSPEEHAAVQPQTEIVSQSDSLEAAEETRTAESLETPKVDEKKAKEEQISNQYALLARKEKALRAKQQQQEQAISQREAAIAAKEAELAAKESEYKSGYIQKSRLKSNPLEALAEAELSYDDLTQQLLNQTPTDPRMQQHISKLEEQIRRLELASEESKKAVQTQQDAAYKAAVKQIETDVTRLVNSDANFETIRATNSVSDVVELIEKTFQEDQVLMSVEEAAQLVEDYLVEEAEKLMKLDKIKKKLLAPQAEARKSVVEPTKEQPPQSQQPQTMKTLTNANSSPRKMTARERALAAFKGELKG